MEQTALQGVLFKISRAPATAPTPAPAPVPDPASEVTALPAAPTDHANPEAPPATTATSSATQEPPAAAAHPEKAEATGPVSYLLGTIHFGTPEEQGFDYAKLEPLLAQTQVLVNEIDPASSIRPEDASYIWLEPSRPLSRMIGAQAFASARELLPAVRKQNLERSKPWRVLSLLEARGELVDQNVMDSRIQAMALSHRLPIKHLETLQQQLEALDCVPANEQATVLVQRLEKPWVLGSESERALRFYRQRDLTGWLADIDRMDGLDQRAKPIEAHARQCLIDDRNRRWMVELERLLPQQPSFIAVGAIHLAGSNGLVAALRRAGYLVEAVPF